MIIRSRAPLRLGLAGGGTDVSPFADEQGGFVLNATISLYAHANLAPSPDGRLGFAATDINQRIDLDAEGSATIEGPLPLHAGVHNRVVREFRGGAPLAVTLTTYSDVLPGSGLGSSSTLVVAMLKAYVEYLQLPLGEYEIARLAFEIERLDLGMTGGRQDQYAATFGGFNFMEFERDERVIVNPLRIKHWIVSELESSLVLFDTGQSRVSSSVIDEQVAEIRKGTTKSLEALVALKADAVAMKAALLRGDLAAFARILDRGWAHKKQTAQAVTNDRLDGIYRAAKDAGAIAGKVSGAGGGGFMIFMVDPIRRHAVIEALGAQPGRVVPCSFTEHGTEGWRIN